MREYYLTKVHKSNYHFVVCIYLFLACAHLCNDVIEKKQCYSVPFALLGRWETPVRLNLSDVKEKHSFETHSQVPVSASSLKCSVYLTYEFVVTCLFVKKEILNTMVLRLRVNVFRCLSNLHANQFHLIYAICSCRGVAPNRTFCSQLYVWIIQRHVMKTRFGHLDNDYHDCIACNWIWIVWMAKSCS